MEFKSVCDAMYPRFQEFFGDGNSLGGEKPILFFAPGRVNLIGEHTDYNGGHVFPCAISLGTWALAFPRPEPRIRIHSMNADDRPPIAVGTRGIENRAEYDWGSYPLGVVRTLELHGYPLPSGLDILFWGDLPAGAGLSSSASLEVLTGTLCNELFDLGIDPVDMARLCQEAENRFVGMQCGIMDQFTVGMGKKNCAILLDCNTLSYRYAPLFLAGCRIVITNTNKPHRLSSSDYNLRRAQCEAAAADIARVRPLKFLGELTETEFEHLAGTIQDPVNRRRARHAVFENQRTLRAVHALEHTDLRTFGQLMNASHVSLRDDYEVTGPELDALAEMAWKMPGVIGSRMTGAGFGGCTVSIVEDQAVEPFKTKIGPAYERLFGYAPSFYVAETADGARSVVRRS